MSVKVHPATRRKIEREFQERQQIQVVIEGRIITRATISELRNLEITRYGKQPIDLITLNYTKP